MEHYGIFASKNGDRRIDSKLLAKYLGALANTGVLFDEDRLTATNTGTNMITTIGVGRAVIRGRIYDNDSPLELVHPAADPLYNRKDLIVLRCDNREESRFIQLMVLPGIPAENPLAPDYMRDEEVYDLVLYQMTVLAGQSVVDAVNLVDARGDSILCPYATSAVLPPATEVDGIAFYQVWDSVDPNIAVTVQGYADSDYRRVFVSTKQDIESETISLSVNERTSSVIYESDEVTKLTKLKAGLHEFVFRVGTPGFFVWKIKGGGGSDIGFVTSLTDVKADTYVVCGSYTKISTATTFRATTSNASVTTNSLQDGNYVPQSASLLFNGANEISLYLFGSKTLTMYFSEAKRSSDFKYWGGPVSTTTVTYTFSGSNDGANWETYKVFSQGASNQQTHGPYFAYSAKAYKYHRVQISNSGSFKIGELYWNFLSSSDDQIFPKYYPEVTEDELKVLSGGNLTLYESSFVTNDSPIGFIRPYWPLFES